MVPSVRPKLKECLAGCVVAAGLTACDAEPEEPKEGWHSCEGLQLLCSVPTDPDNPLPPPGEAIVPEDHVQATRDLTIKGVVYLSSVEAGGDAADELPGWPLPAYGFRVESLLLSQDKVKVRLLRQTRASETGAYEVNVTVSDSEGALLLVAYNPDGVSSSQAMVALDDANQAEPEVIQDIYVHVQGLQKLTLAVLAERGITSIDFESDAWQQALTLVGETLERIETEAGSEELSDLELLERLREDTTVIAFLDTNFITDQPASTPP